MASGSGAASKSHSQPPPQCRLARQGCGPVAPRATECSSSRLSPRSAAHLHCVGMSLLDADLSRFAVPAFLIIATVRGVLLNFGVYYAARAALGLTEFEWSPAIG